SVPAMVRSVCHGKAARDHAYSAVPERNKVFRDNVSTAIVINSDSTNRAVFDRAEKQNKGNPFVCKRLDYFALGIGRGDDQSVHLTFAQSFDQAFFL
ncbi:hypothetical protein ADUPG1_005538, partial [Aduncisulcus paluster]